MRELLEAIKQRYGLDTLVWLDFETFYKTKGSVGNKSLKLGGSTLYNYIFDPRFHETGVGVGEDEGDIEFIHDPEELGELMDEFQGRREGGERIGVVAFNTGFDCAVANWRFGTTFDMYFDVQGMRQLLFPNAPKNLAQAAIDQWPDDATKRKGEELAMFDGIEYQYMSESDREILGRYCIQDVALTRDLFYEYIGQIFIGGLAEEIELMHITLRAAIEPQFVIDTSPLIERIAIEKAKKKSAWEGAVEFLAGYNFDDLDPKDFSSNPRFAALLEQLSMEVPMKMSKTTHKPAPALANGDPDYVRLQINNPEFEPVFRARRLSKSTNALTRAEKFIEVSNIFDWMSSHNKDMAQTMPFFLNYLGAGQTGRWSGGQRLNQQNLTADRLGDNSDGHHRRSLLAPKGYQVAVSDLSNIELRVNQWFCGQNDVLAQMAVKDYDYYCDVAEGIFDRVIVKKVDKNERQMGKAAGLGLGFAMGWKGFQLYLASGPLGMDPMFKDDTFCKKVKDSYDGKHPFVRNMWNFIANTVIPALVHGNEVRFGPNDSVVAYKDAIRLPSGRVLSYPNARYEGKESKKGFDMKVVIDSTLVTKFGRKVPKGIWHGLIIENIVQAIARDVLAWQMVRVERYLNSTKFGWLVGSVHDETLSLIKDEIVGEAFAEIQRIMSTGPDWADGIPLENEGGYAPEYSK